MKESPILFSAPMVRAILDGTKTQTRRVVKPQPDSDEATGACWIEMAGRHQFAWYSGEDQDILPNEPQFFCPYGQPGDRLWVRESGVRLLLRAPEDTDQPYLFRHDVPATHELGYYWVQRTRATGASYSTQCTRDQFLDTQNTKVVPSIHMPRWASRITLEITAVRVERLNDISEADAVAEGTTPSIVGDDLDHLKYRAGYQTLWESINGPGSWEANPWVWVIEFNAIKGASA